MIKLKNITKTYFTKGGVSFRAVNNVSLSFEETGLVFILGKSGSGKTTLLNLIGALDRIDQGSIYFGEKNLSELKDRELDSYRNTFVGFIFQHYNLIPNFNVYENIKLALDFKHISDEKIIKEYAEKLEVEHLLDKKVFNLSGGERQRITILRSLVKNPKILLADEPSGALDTNSAERLYELLKNLSKEKLVIVVSHDREVASRYADRIIEIKDGEIFKDLSTTPKKSGEAKSALIANTLVKIPSGKELDETEVRFVNEFLDKTASETFLSVENSENKVKSLYPFLAEAIKQEDDEETYEQYVYSELDYKTEKFIQTKMNLKTTASLSIKNLNHKKFKLILTIILTFFSATLFMFSTDIKEFNLRKSTTDSIAKNRNNQIRFGIENRNALNGINFEYPDFSYKKSYYLPEDLLSHKEYKGSLYSDKRITGIIEASKPLDFNLNIIGGKEITAEDETIISEFLAWDIMKILKISSIDGVLGQNINCGTQTLKIIGYYDCDLEKYSEKVERNYYFRDFVDEMDAFWGRVFVKEGFYEKTMKGLSSFYHPNGGITINFNEFSVMADVFNGTNSETVIETSEKKAIYISANLYQKLFKKSFNSSDLEEAKENINELNKHNILKLQTSTYINSITFFVQENIIVKGVVNDYRAYDTIYASQEFFDEVNLESNQNFDYFYVPKAFFKKNANKKIDLLIDNNIYFANSANNVLNTFNQMKSSLSNFLKGLSYVVTAFVILLIYSFLSSSIKNSKKQIGLLRALGAGNLDIFKIFLIETLIFVGATFIISYILHDILRILLNSKISNTIGATVNLIPFNFFTIYNALVLMVVTISLALIIPLLRIFKMTPIEAINEKDN